MFNKLIYALILLAFTAALPVSLAQTAKKNRKKQTAQVQRDAGQDNGENKQVQQKRQTVKDPQQEIRRLMKIDPRLPGSGAGRAKVMLDDIRKNYAEREFPRKMSNFHPGDSNTATGLKVIAISYKKSLSHPDLEEATGIRLSWYNEAGAAFVALYQYLDEVERGAMMGQEKRYTMSALKYLELAKKLGKILDKPEKIPSKELEKIKEANTERRKLEIRKKINELMRQRSTGK